MSDRLVGAWEAEAAKRTKYIVNAILREDWNTVYAEISKIDVSVVMKGQIKYLGYLSVAALLYGAGNLAGSAKASKLNEEGETIKAVKSRAEKLFMIYLTEGNKAIHQQLQRSMVKVQDILDEGKNSVLKAETASPKKRITDVVGDATTRLGNQAINLSASLHTSRLSTYGFMLEAGISDITRYQISEQLDKRTCPVCQTMHGKEFEISAMRSDLETILGSDDPEIAKVLAPWPKQDRSSVDALSKMTEQELLGHGYKLPPFHPGCRGVIVKTGTVPSTNVKAPAYETPLVAGSTPEGVATSVVDQSYEALTAAFPDPSSAVRRSDIDIRISDALDAHAASLMVDSGFTKPPTKVLEREYQSVVDASPYGELMRGVTSPEYLQQFKTGLYYRGNRGVYGRGIYAAYGEDKVILTQVYANGSPDNVLAMSLRADAKVASYAEYSNGTYHEILAKAFKAKYAPILADLNAELGLLTGVSDLTSTIHKDKISAEITFIESVISGVYRLDPGTLLPMLGFDAFDISGADKYLVIYNRSKVVYP